MYPHPNWVALSTVGQNWNTFVQASCDKPPHDKPRKILDSITGFDAQVAYEEVLTLPSQRKEERVNNQILTNLDKPVNTTLSRQQLNEAHWINVLMKEASANNVKKVDQLLGSHGDVNITDQFGWTMLMCASHAGAVDVVRYLLDKNADTSMKDKSGFTCSSLARRQRHFAVLRLFENHSKLRVTESKSVVNRNVSKLFCEVCKQHFEDSPSKPHKYSTVHLFNVHPRKHSTWYGIPDNNKGFQLMIKSGWNREEGLGPHGSGSKVPPKSVFKTDRKGFGIKSDVPRVTHFQARDERAVESRYVKNEQKRSKSSTKLKISSERRKERYLRRELNF